MEIHSSPVGAKFQITLPKRVREVLGITKQGDLVGFRVEGKRVTLGKAQIRFGGEDFTEQEYALLLARVRRAPKRTYTAEQFLKRMKRLHRELDRSNSVRTES